MPADVPDLAAVAGVSLRAPQERYAVEGLSFGDAALTRANGPASRFNDLDLALTPDAAARCAAQKGAAALRVSFALHELAPAHTAGLGEDDARLAGVRTLLVEHALLAQPALLVAANDRIDRTSTEGQLLAQLRATYEQIVGGGRGRAAKECRDCVIERRKAYNAQATLDLADLTARIKAAKTPRDAALLQQEYHTRRYMSSMYQTQRREADCPHVALAREALEALCARHAEVMFELVGLIEPAGRGAMRFVLREDVARAAVSHWITGRVRPRYVHWSQQRSTSAARGRRVVSARERALATQGLPAEQRAGVSYAATAWSYEAPVATLGWTPSATDSGAPPSIREGGDEGPYEVSRVLPPFAQKAAAREVVLVRPPGVPVVTVEQAKKTVVTKKRPAVKTAPAPAPTKKAAAKKTAAQAPKMAAAKKTAPVAAAKAAPVAVPPETRAMLRKLGVSDALIDEMAREGRLRTR